MEERIAAMETEFRPAYEAWLNRPLIPVLDEAIGSESGVSYDWVKCNGVIVSAVVCVVPKREKTKMLTADILADMRGNSRLDIEKLRLYDVVSQCFQQAFGLATVMVLRDPDAVIYAAIDQRQIEALREKFNLP
jgi:hypothetical protein